MLYLKPIKLLILSGLIWLFSFLTLPATYVELGGATWFPILTLVLFNLLFILGIKSVKGAKATQNEISIQKKTFLVLLFFSIGAVGVLIKVYQRVFIEKIYFAENLVRTRMDLMAGELNSGILGLLSALTYPFATIALMLAIIWIKNMSRFTFIIILLVGLFPIYDSILTESRLLIVFIVGMLGVCYLASGINLFKSYKRIKLGNIKLLSIPDVLFKKKVWIPMLIIAIGFTVFSQKVINNRLATFSYIDTMKVWEHYHQVEVDKDFKKMVKTSNSNVEKNKLIATYSLKHYFAHSVFEYIRLNNHLEKSWGYYYGMFEFYTYFKLFKLLGFDIPPFSELNKISYKPAVYSTFWGPFYIDFGVFGFVISFLLGRSSQRIYLKARQNSPIHILLYAFIAMVILASFFLNFATGGNLYFLNAIVVTIIFIQVWPNKLVFRH